MQDMPTHLGLDPSLVDFSRPADPDVPPFIAAARAAYAARGGGGGGDEVPELYEDGAEQYDEEEDDGEYYDDDEEDEEHEAKEAVYAKRTFALSNLALVRICADCFVRLGVSAVPLVP